ncbi:MAG: tRNA (guanosine(37)-N1)-methyltransferase TrmD [Bdellovibrionales bacterium]|jgi:tRNA (guanine37-N1)-methyltransferase|nr:tRNA (guanosine(37)-N1)-methyltransferase TrmD [Bdellovibrionales bacterium]
MSQRPIAIHVVTLMPDLVRSAVAHGVIGQALKDGVWQLDLVNPREFTSDVHHTVDDRVFGGSDGMLMLAETLARSVEKVRTRAVPLRVIHLSPRGRKFDDRLARDLAQTLAAGDTELVLIASRYAGVDERFIEEFCDDEVSVGDYVVSGGELPAAIMIDAILRHVPGVLGNQASSENDSFSNGLLESAQYTRPREWRGRDVPTALLSGDPAVIDDWKFAEGLRTTLERRPDLLSASSVAERDSIVEKLLAIEQRAHKAVKASKSASVKASAAQEILVLLDQVKVQLSRLVQTKEPS